MARGVVCFGELLLRFTAPGSERLMQSPVFDVHHGGAEANVAVSLARLGHPARMVSALPDNAFGASMLTALKGQGVDVSSVLSAPGRMGLYFLETGAVRRPSRIVYDRAGSVFAETLASRYDWPALLDGAEWLHLSGITPAVGPEPAKAALTAVSAARKAGVRVSFDGNYRQALWEVWGGDGPALICEILESVDTAFINASALLSNLTNTHIKFATSNGRALMNASRPECADDVTIQLLRMLRYRELLGAGNSECVA